MISKQTNRVARDAWRRLLGEYLGAPPRAETGAARPWARAWDDTLACGDLRFAVEYKVRSDTASVSAALERVRERRRDLPAGVHPLLVVDHMGGVGGALCEREGIDWLDLSGNARITRPPRTRIIVEGRAPASRPRGRQRDLFATKSSRLAHWLLLNADQAHSHQQLVEATGLDKGHLSRLLSRMEELRLISRQGGGIRLSRPDVMLDAWRESYKPPCGHILKGVVPSRSGQDTMERVGSAMEASGIRHAFGGLAAAWAWDGYADFRLATCYLEGGASADLLRDIGFVETERGANLWLMTDADRVAFLGRQQRNGVCVASPWFTYADLLIHPERAADASSHLRQHVLKLETGDGA